MSHEFLSPKQWLAEDKQGLSQTIPFLYGQFLLNMTLQDATNITHHTLVALKQIFHSFHMMICLLMSPKESTIRAIDVHVKLFSFVLYSVDAEL